MPLADRIAAARVEAQEATLIAQLRRRLGEIDPRSAQAHQGYILLGNAEGAEADGRRRPMLMTALAVRFDPTIAAEAPRRSPSAGSRHRGSGGAVPSRSG
jgi:hypothetical protein